MERLFYLYLAGCIFWLGLWAMLGWLMYRIKRIENQLKALSSSDDTD